MTSHANIAKRIETSFQRQLELRRQTLTVYEVVAGDTLNHIIREYYGIAPGGPRYTMALAHVRYFNPTLTDPNLIKTGQLLRLPPIEETEDAQPYCSPGDPTFSQEDYGPTLQRILSTGALAQMKAQIPTTQPERDLFFLLAWLHQNYDYLSIGAGSGLGTWGNVVSDANRAIIADVTSLYESYKAGRLTKGQYDFRRRQALNKFAKLVGPFEKWLFKGQTTQEAIRISRTKALPATAKIEAQLGRLGKMANYAKHGGLLLTAAGVGMGCYNIAQTQNQQEKNEIFVETVTSAAVGTIASVALGVMLVGTPVGWVTAIILGTGTTLAAYGSGKGVRMLYTNSGDKIDLVNGLGINKVCR